MTFKQAKPEDLVLNNRTVPFISRHAATPAQKATLALLGFEQIQPIELIFGDDPGAQLKELGIEPGPIALVAPMAIAAQLLNERYELIEFKNAPSARAKGGFVCLGVTQLALGGGWKPKINRVWTACPIPVEQQEMLAAI